MKLILTGSTGFIGQEILLQCLSSPKITSVIVLSRRALHIQDPKLKIVILEDFTDIPEHVMEELKGCEGVIWYDRISCLFTFWIIVREYLETFPSSFSLKELVGLMAVEICVGP